MNFALVVIVLIIGIISVLSFKGWFKKDQLLTEAVSNVFVIRTHIWNDYVEQVFLKMQHQLGKENVFLLFDETNGPIQQPHINWNDPIGLWKGPGIITINEDDCNQINLLHAVGEKTGSINRAEAQVYACYHAIKRDYDYLWFIEFDVYCNDYKQALTGFDTIKADMLTTFVKQQKSNKKWFWWPFLIGEISNVPMAQRVGCFFPINRFSRKFLNTLEQNLSKSTGYCEIYFPTLCISNGLLLKELPLRSLGAFRYRPVINGKEFKRIKDNDKRLYHPVKEVSPCLPKGAVRSA